MQKTKTVEMDELCEIASNLLEYIWYGVLGETINHTVMAPNGDYNYRDESQDIFNTVLDILDNQLNPEVSEHGEWVCSNYSNQSVLPDEDNSCSLCGAKLISGYPEEKGND